MLRGNTADSRDSSTQWTSLGIEMLVTTRICCMPLTDTLALSFQRTAVLKHVCSHTGVPKHGRIIVKAWALVSASKAPRTKNFCRYNYLQPKGETEKQKIPSFSKKLIMKKMKYYIFKTRNGKNYCEDGEQVAELQLLSFHPHLD